MREVERSDDESEDERVRWDFGAILLALTIVVVLLWLTWELWNPHWEPR